LSSDFENLPRRILVIDDQAYTHVTFQAILGADPLCPINDSSSGGTPDENTTPTLSRDTYDLAFAFQGQEGLQKVESAISQGQPFMVAFVDMRMPGWDGLETIEHLWFVDPNMQVVICTGHSEYSHSEIVQRLGKTDQLLLLKKPFDAAEVAQIASALVQKWILHRRAALRMDELDTMVMERTRELQTAIDTLQLEMSERLKAEDNLARSVQQLERSNAELEQFAHIASHDLKEPLRIVGIFVQLLSKKYEGKLDPDADDYITYAVDGVERMSALLDSLLAYSRVSASGRVFSPIQCDSVLDGTLAMLQPSLDESGATVSHDPLPRIQGNEEQLSRLFMNLLTNAIKFRREDAPRIHISAEDRGEEWVFSVQDNGIGIAPEYADQVSLQEDRGAA
jgi:signal transduction histidine kinase